MKTGVIVYVVQGENVGQAFDMEKAVMRLGIKADRVAVVSSIESNFDVMHAWWMLTVKGMKLIVCMIAEVVNRSKLKLTGRVL